MSMKRSSTAATKRTPVTVSRKNAKRETPERVKGGMPPSHIFPLPEKKNSHVALTTNHIAAILFIRGPTSAATSLAVRSRSWRIGRNFSRFHASSEWFPGELEGRI
jgi:hypothetical protein